jgi:hypothetical protein
MINSRSSPDRFLVVDDGDLMFLGTLQHKQAGRFAGRTLARGVNPERRPSDHGHAVAHLQQRLMELELLTATEPAGASPRATIVTFLSRSGLGGCDSGAQIQGERVLLSGPRR